MIKLSINKDFQSREDLDKYVRATFGDNPNANKELSIEADEEALQKMNLSENATVHGVKIIKKTNDTEDNIAGGRTKI